MPVTLPNYYVITAARGSEWSSSFQLQNDDGSLMDIIAKTFTFVARPSTSDRTSPPKLEVTSTLPTSQGEILVDLGTSTVLVIINATATDWAGGFYTLWMNAGLPDAEALAQGEYVLQSVATP